MANISTRKATMPQSFDAGGKMSNDGFYFILRRKVIMFELSRPKYFARIVSNALIEIFRPVNSILNTPMHAASILT